MILADRFTRDIGVRAITGTTTDDYGNPVPVETVTTVVGHWRQLSADELGPNEVDAVAYRVHLPADTVLDAGARLDLDGELVEVVGTPQPLYDPRRRAVVALVCRAEVAR